MSESLPLVQPRKVAPATHSTSAGATLALATGESKAAREKRACVGKTTAHDYSLVQAYPFDLSVARTCMEHKVLTPCEDIDSLPEHLTSSHKCLTTRATREITLTTLRTRREIELRSDGYKRRSIVSHATQGLDVDFRHGVRSSTW